VKASPGALFDALTSLTSLSGLAAWRVPQVTGYGDADGELKFFMNSPEPLVIHVDEATRLTSVQWTVTECSFLPDWVGMRPTFTITPVDGDASELQFRHHGSGSRIGLHRHVHSRLGSLHRELARLHQSRPRQAFRRQRR
jgi:hypothetical protein